MLGLIDTLTTLAQTTAEERGRLVGMALGGIVAIIIGIIILKKKKSG